MQKFSHIFNSAVARLKNGESLETVLSAYPQEVSEHLRPLLLLIQDLASFKTTEVPEPAKRKLYLEHSYSRHLKFSFSHLFKNAYVLSLFVFLFGLCSTAYATFISLPGDNFFALKKGIESVQLSLVKDPESKADLQLSIANRRLEEAQEVIYSKQDPQAQSKALEELNKQTTEALNNIEAIAQNPNVAKNPRIAEKVQKAESLAQSQTTLAAAVDQKSADQNSKVLQNKLSSIRQVIATSSEQSFAEIPSLTKFEKTDEVKLIKDNTVVLKDNSTYEVNPSQITVTDAKDEKISLADIAIGDTVTIAGQSKENQNFATSITKVTKPKTIDAPKTPDSSTEKSTEKSVGTKNNSASTQQSEFKQETKTPILEKPQDTYGGFILEPVTESAKSQN